MAVLRAGGNTCSGVCCLQLKTHRHTRCLIAVHNTGVDRSHAGLRSVANCIHKTTCIKFTPVQTACTVGAHATSTLVTSAHKHLPVSTGVSSARSVHDTRALSMKHNNACYHMWQVPTTLQLQTNCAQDCNKAYAKGFNKRVAVFHRRPSGTCRGKLPCCCC